jgi:putative ABC transport system permease protein
VLLLELLGLGVLASALGTGLGVLLEERLLALVAQLLPQALVGLRMESLAYGPIVGVLCLSAFAVPPLLEAASIPPMHVLRPGQFKRHLKGVTYLPPALLVIGLLLSVGFTPLLVIQIAGGLSLFVLIMVGSLTLIIRMLGWWSPGWLSLRMALRQLTRSPAVTARQTLWLMLVLSVWSILSSARFELLEEWRSKLDAESPNYFVMNLMASEREPYLKYLDDRGLSHSELYPITRGRLIAINGASITDRVLQDPKLEGALNRELSLTRASTLPAGNRIVAGSWDRDEGVSMEQKLAQQLGVGIGDRLSFLIQGKTLEARVTSLRTVVWDTMTPNFYLIFREGSLSAFPTTWLGSFHIGPEQRTVLSELVRAFPSASLIDVEKIIGHFRMIIEEVTLAFEVLWSLAMVAAVLTLILTIAASMEERLREYAIQRILGATPKLIRTTQFLDFMLLGLLASGCALLLSELVLNGLGYFVLDTAPHFHPRTAWGVSLFGGCCITLIGLLVSHLMQGREWRLGRRY